MSDTVSYMRHERLLDPQIAKQTHINILGCGTVGSNAAIQLAKAGFGSLSVWDMDVVESHNIPSQDFSIVDIGKNKADITSQRASLISSHIKTTWNGEVSADDVFMMSGVLICALDSMEMRKSVFEVARQNGQIGLFIDFRMSGKNLQVWAFDPKSEWADKYADTLYSSGDTIEAVCGTKTFAPVGALSGAYATEVVSRYVMENETPFFTIIDWDSLSMNAVGWH